MFACTFFGHRDSPPSIRPLLEKAVVCLIEKHGVTHFYVGTHGNFDVMAASVLSCILPEYPHVRCEIVLPCLPTVKCDYPFETILPAGIESVPKRYCILFRNKWMLKKSDFVISYAPHSFGNAAKLTELAYRSNKTIVRLQNEIPPQE